jgi:hypothetical protein
MCGGLVCKKIGENEIWTKSRGLDIKWLLKFFFIQNQDWNRKYEELREFSKK